MRKNLFFLLIIFIFAACAKQEVDTKKEASKVREAVSKIAGKNIHREEAVKVAEKQLMVTKEIDFSLLEPSGFIYPYENRKDPFYSLMLEREKMKAELEEKKRKEEEEKKMAELGANIFNEEWGKIEIAAILGDGEGYLVLFGGDDTIYQKNDYIGKDKKIRIEDIDKNSVNLTMMKGNNILNRQIEMKAEK
ncbi:MAG: hypothetical protein AB1498_04225 [bacterium]